MAKKVLLHTCCAPCLLYPYKVLVESGYEVICFWYNPNIFPYNEKQKRYNVLRAYCEKNNIPFYSQVSIPEDFFKGIFLLQKFPSRCSRCWFLRLKKAAIQAKKLGCDAFTTTLLVSKYQNPNEINRLGKIISEELEIKYLEFDFRDGFNWAHEKAKELGMYLQKWCGCIFSYNARLRARRRKRKK